MKDCMQWRDPCTLSSFWIQRTCWAVWSCMYKRTSPHHRHQTFSCYHFSQQLQAGPKKDKLAVSTEVIPIGKLVPIKPKWAHIYIFLVVVCFFLSDLVWISKQRFLFLITRYFLLKLSFFSFFSFIVVIIIHILNLFIYF